ncbi:MAG: hypothetical protein ACI9KE_003721 [Polyangiales bacterium]
MIRVIAALLVAIPMSAVSSSAEAQSAEGFDSDRPGYSNSTAAAPVLRPILEMGAGFTFDEDDPETISAPNFLIRFGISKWLELRLAIPSVVGVFGPGPNGVAFGDTTIGLKVAASPTERFSTSFVPSLSIATEGGVNTGRIEWNWLLSLGAVSIGGNLAAGTVNLGTAVVQGEGSLALGISITEAVGVFGQVFVIWPRSIDPLPFVGAGITAQVAPRFQLDATLDVGLTDDTTRVSFSAGMTILVGEGEETMPPAPQ